MRDSYIVNWRSEIDRLSPFLDGRGGVVAIRATASAPASVFARTIRTLMENASPQWKHVQIEPSNANTRYLPEIIFQMYKSFGISPGGNAAANTPPPVVIGSEIEAGGDVEISNVTVTIGGDTFDHLVREDRRIQRLVDALAEILQTRRAAVVTLAMQKSSRQTLQQVRQRLWEGALATLTKHGLLLVDISNFEGRAGDGLLWPPPADVQFELSERFDDASSADACEDLRRIALEEGVVTLTEEADVFARTLLAAFPSIRELHAKLASTLAALG